MEPVNLLGTPDIPEVFDRAALSALRSPAGDPPCSDGLRRAFKLLDDEGKISRADLLAKLGTSDAEWAEGALGVYGSGSGYGDGDGYGSGSGSGYGDGYGDGSGYGSGSGYGDGSGYGSGSGYGDGYGSGSGDGSGSGKRRPAVAP